MQESIDISVTLSTFLTENGLEIYVGEDDLNPSFVDLRDEVEEFLNDSSNEDGVLFDAAKEELEVIITMFKDCLQRLEDAKR